MTALFRHLTIINSIVISVAAVFICVLIPAATLDLIGRRRQVETSAEQQAVAALDMLEAVHVQAMLNRDKTPDGDPAIATLNGTMEQFSQDSRGVKLWVFMGPKVLAFQKAHGETELEGPLDEVDRLTAATGHGQKSFDGQTLRLSRPVVLGSGHAAQPRCAECHTGLMSIEPGELVGGYSASVDTSSAMAAWRRGTIQTIAWASGLFLLVIAAIYVLLRSLALRPLQRLSFVTRTLANGHTDVIIDLDEHPDAIGSMAKSLKMFRDSLIAKRQLEASHAAINLELKYLALHDSLTGLPNRVDFRNRLDKALGEAGDGVEGIAVLALDLDHFKEVNDTLGHEAGDRLANICR